MRLAKQPKGAKLIYCSTLETHLGMIPLEEKIERTQRLLRRLEEDQPLLALRVAPLGHEHQQSAKRFAAQLLDQTRAELQKLREKQSQELDFVLPSPAD